MGPKLFFKCKVEDRQFSFHTLPLFTTVESIVVALKAFFSLSFLWFCHSDKKREKSKRKNPTTSHTNNTGGNCVTHIHKTLQLFTCFFKISIILSRRMAASLFFFFLHHPTICSNLQEPQKYLYNQKSDPSLKYPSVQKAK